jgi:hypothetical protein
VDGTRIAPRSHELSLSALNCSTESGDSGQVETLQSTPERGLATVVAIRLETAAESYAACESALFAWHDRMLLAELEDID